MTPQTALRTRKIGLPIAALLAVIALGLFGGTAGATELPPENTSLPTLSTSTPHSYQLVSATEGKWNNKPTKFSYSWNRCAPTCEPIAGATGGSYTPVAADLGARLSVTVTATNEAGSTPATSAQSGIVTEMIAWYQCKSTTVGTGVFEDSGCSTEGGSKSYVWNRPNGVPIAETTNVINGEAGLFHLIWLRPGSKLKFEVLCSKSQGYASLSNGQSSAKLSSYAPTLSECFLNQPSTQYKCTIPEGKIPFKAMKAESKGLEQVLNFNPSSGTLLTSFKLESCNYNFYDGEYSVSGSFAAQFHDPGSFFATSAGETEIAVASSNSSWLPMESYFEGGSSIKNLEGNRALKLDVAP